MQIPEPVKVIGRPIKHAAIALARRPGMVPGKAHTPIPDNLVISTGGAGTTFLMKHLARFITLNDPHDSDGIKHLPGLPEAWRSSKRILYIHGPPEEVYLSLKRRGWLHIHAGNLGCVLCQFTFGRLRQRLFERAVQRQIELFHSYDEDCVMLLNYADIWDSIANIQTFFGIKDSKFVEEFPPYRPRKSVGS